MSSKSDPGCLDLHPDLSRAPGGLLNIFSCPDYYQWSFFRLFFSGRPSLYCFFVSGYILFVFPAGHLFIFMCVSGYILFLFPAGRLSIFVSGYILFFCLAYGFVFPRPALFFPVSGFCPARALAPSTVIDLR